MTGALLLLADISTWGIGQWVICILVVAGVVSIGFVVLKHLNITLPPVLLTIIGIVFAVVIGVVAIKFLMQL